MIIGYDQANLTEFMSNTKHVPVRIRFINKILLRGLKAYKLTKLLVKTTFQFTSIIPKLLKLSIFSNLLPVQLLLVFPPKIIFLKIADTAVQLSPAF